MKDPHKTRVTLDEVEAKTLNHDGSDSFLTINGKPFSGFVIGEKFHNGAIQEEEEYIEGENFGWEVEYFENGQIQSEAFRMGYVEFFFQEYDECGNKTEGGYLLNEKFVSKMLKEYKIDVSFE